MKEWFKELYQNCFGNEIPMRIRFLHLCTLGGTLGALLATIAPLITGVYSIPGIIVCLLTVVFFFGLFVFTQTTANYDAVIIIGVCGLNFIIYPLLYFSMGGIQGGMVLYFIMGIVFSLLLLNLKQSLAIFPMEILCYITIFILGDKYPELFSDTTRIDCNYTFDTALDFAVVSLTTFCVIKILYNAYENQQARAEALVRELEDLSITDPLTKVRNRRFLMQSAESELKKTKRDSHAVAVIMFDIDKFKSVNDTYGHLVGDEVLKNFASILSTHCREYDIVARYGGEEFVILLPQTTESVAFNRAEEIRRTVENSELCSSQHIPITASGGVAIYNPDTMHSVEDFIGKADTYLYEAKETGRNKIIWQHNSKGLAK